MVSCRRSKGRKSHPRRLITSCSRLARAPREHTANSCPVCQDGTNPTRTGWPLALDSATPSRSLSRRTRRTAFSGFGSDRTPALRSELNLPSANSVFCSYHSSFAEAYNNIDRKPSPALFSPLTIQIIIILGEGTRQRGEGTLCFVRFAQ